MKKTMKLAMPVLGLLLALPAYAQMAAAPAAPATAPTAPSPATPPAIPSAPAAIPLGKARELMKIMHIDETLTQHMSNDDDIQRSGVFLVAKIAEANPGEESKINDLLVEADHAILPQIIPGYVDYMAKAYASVFTPQELDQLATFYKTESMQEILEKTTKSTEVPQMSKEEQDQSFAFQQTPVGKKLQQKSPYIMQKVNLYAADAVRKKQRNLVYAQLRKTLPEHGLKVPEPFEPDTFMDQTIHDNTVRANTLPPVMPGKVK